MEHRRSRKSLAIILMRVTRRIYWLAYPESKGTGPPFRFNKVLEHVTKGFGTSVKPRIPVINVKFIFGLSTVVSLPLCGRIARENLTLLKGTLPVCSFYPSYQSNKLSLFLRDWNFIFVNFEPVLLGVSFLPQHYCKASP